MAVAALRLQRRVAIGVCVPVVEFSFQRIGRDIFEGPLGLLELPTVLRPLLGLSSWSGLFS